MDSSAPAVTTHDSAVQNQEVNGAPGVTTFIGIGVAIPVVLMFIGLVVAVTLVLLYLRKSSHPKAKSDYDNSYSLCRVDTQQPCAHPHSRQPPTDLYDQIQLSPSTGQAEIVSKAKIENTNTLSSHQTSVSPNTDTDHCNKISGQDNVATSEQPTYAAVDNKQKKKKKGQEVVLSGHFAEKGDTKKKIKQREATPTSLHTTESPEALYSVVKKKPKADKEETVPPPPPHSLEELYTAVKKNVKGSAMEEEEGAPQIPPHTIEELYTAVVKKPKGDSTERETDGAPPIPPHTVDDC